MNVLKSLEDFKKESNVLESAQLKQVSGGYIRKWQEPTCVGDRSDISYMEAEYRYNGREYVLYGVAFQRKVVWGSLEGGT
ncbi:hypothetical protein OIU83_01260 [Flavobacterium sp. LS1R49]|uniref:Uncharacterized protein n=1 Tax=Flavobacterium shii TaxID=2987687 RepID=A0A9X3C3Y6_9FLAO|nr:hypothetical protein [Flavobacterium shii]MCV9926264.1 hypothetical protein [Flavobacterium shii]